MAKEAVYNYLKIQNRPYNVNDIISNLQKQYDKSTIQKSLDLLVENGLVLEKTYGKQKIYCILQEMKQGTQDLMRHDKELEIHANEVEEQYQTLLKLIKAEETSLSKLKSCGTTEDIIKQRNDLKQTIKNLTIKLDTLMGSTSTENLSDIKRKAEKDIDAYSREYTKRKRLCMEIVDCILENYPGDKKSFYEDVGIEPKTV